jgi:hypothetical protein
MTQELIPSFGYPEKPWKILFALATTGVSTAQELFQYKGHYGPVTSLCTTGLVEKELVQIYGKVKILLVKLTPRGADFCRQKGWKVVESEWTFMSRLHPSDTGSQKHTAAVLWFAGIARYFEWKVELLPKKLDPFLKPDLLMEKDGLTVLGEVETKPRGRFEKWQSLGRLAAQHGWKVGVCALSRLHRSRLVEECKQSGIKGLATDLQTLSENRSSKILWAEEFSRWYG